MSPPNFLQYFFKNLILYPIVANRGTGPLVAHFVTVAVLLAVKWQTFLPIMGRIGRKHHSKTTKTRLAHGLKIFIHEAQPKYCEKLKKNLRGEHKRSADKARKTIKNL
ncbi:MAG: hypothetical protein IKV60_00790 [Rikenellaceae bacterium]|nr:hypothetical protein [Rikenellaceae bacterium]